MSDLKKIIPEPFYKGGQNTPGAQTVGGLIHILKQLPADMLLEGAHLDVDEPAIFVNVYNISEPDRVHVGLETEDLLGE